MPAPPSRSRLKPGAQVKSKVTTSSACDKLREGVDSLQGRAENPGSASKPWATARGTRIPNVRVESDLTHVPRLLRHTNLWRIETAAHREIGR